MLRMSVCGEMCGATVLAKSLELQKHEVPGTTPRGATQVFVDVALLSRAVSASPWHFHHVTRGVTCPLRGYGVVPVRPVVVHRCRVNRSRYRWCGSR